MEFSSEKYKQDHAFKRQIVCMEMSLSEAIFYLQLCKRLVAIIFLSVEYMSMDSLDIVHGTSGMSKQCSWILLTHTDWTLSVDSLDIMTTDSVENELTMQYSIFQLYNVHG